MKLVVSTYLGFGSIQTLRRKFNKLSVDRFEKGRKLVYLNQVLYVYILNNQDMNFKYPYWTLMQVYLTE